MNDEPLSSQVNRMFDKTYESAVNASQSIPQASKAVGTIALGLGALGVSQGDVQAQYEPSSQPQDQYTQQDQSSVQSVPEWAEPQNQRSYETKEQPRETVRSKDVQASDVPLPGTGAVILGLAGGAYGVRRLYDED